MDIEEALTLIGFGKFHYKILVVCALSLISVGFQSNVSGYAFTAAQCELGFSTYELGILNVVYLFGNSISSFFWGILADNFGRKPVLIIAHLSNVVVSLIMALFQNTMVMMIARFCNGFLTSAPGSVIFSYLAEFQPVKYRSLILCISSLFFTTSYLLLPLIASIVLPLDFHLRIYPLVMNSWRLLIIILLIPELLTGLFLLYLPDTPKYFLAKGDYVKTFDVLDRMFTSNKGPCNKMPVKNLRNSKCSNDTSIFDNSGKLAQVIQHVFRQFRQLFQPPLLLLTMLICAVNFASLFGLFGLGLWIPELFIRFQRFEAENPNSTISMKEIAKFSVNSTSCDESMDSSTMMNTIIIGLVSVVTSAISSWVATKTTLKVISFICLLVGGISSFAIYFLQASWQNLIVASAFQSSMIVGNVCIGGMVTDLFPTEIAAITLALVMFAGRSGAMISNYVFGIFMNDYCEIPLFLVSCCLCIGALLCFIIPYDVSNNNVNNNNKLENDSHELQTEISIIR